MHETGAEGPVLDARSLASMMDSVFSPMEVHAQGEFSARARNLAHGEVQFGRVAAQPHVARASGRFAKHRPRWLVCNVQVSGRLELEQGGRRAELGPGDIAFYSTDAPFELRFDGDYEIIAVCLPASWTALRRLDTSMLAGTRLAGTDPVVAAAGPAIESFEQHVGRMDPAMRSRFVALTLDTVETLGTRAAGLVLGDCAEGADLLGRALQRIDEQLADPDLSAATLAAALYVSERRLYALFQDAGMSLAGTIRSRRLEQCRRALADPVNADVPISAICTAWGFSSPTHFSVLFRDAYGVPPSTYRAQHLAAA